MHFRVIAFLFCTLLASAVIADPLPHEPANAGPSAPDPSLPTLFIIGDSTVHNPNKGEEGWGDSIKPFFDGARINVENFALGGRSSRTFRTEGHWQKVLDGAKPGDFVIMQFGHNDGGPIDDAKGRGSLRGIGDDTKDVKKKDGSDETVHTFGWYMEQYMIEGKAKGMTPIVCSYVPRCPRPDGEKPATMPSIPVELTSYALWAKQAADNQHADFINLNGIVWTHYAGLSPDELKAKYFTPADWTHTNPAGAEINARSVVEGLRQLPDNKLTAYLLPDQAK